MPTSVLLIAICNQGRDSILDKSNSLPPAEAGPILATDSVGSLVWLVHGM